jgi:hypothetical protein
MPLTIEESQRIIHRAKQRQEKRTCRTRLIDLINVNPETKHTKSKRIVKKVSTSLSTVQSQQRFNENKRTSRDKSYDKMMTRRRKALKKMKDKK